LKVDSHLSLNIAGRARVPAIAAAVANKRNRSWQKPKTVGCTAERAIMKAREVERWSY
jgi:hypothetical protein